MRFSDWSSDLCSSVLEVYIMILPAFGIVSMIVPTFSRKKLFGYASMVYATSAIAVLSFIVWAHHMFATGMPVAAQLYFMYATMLYRKSVVKGKSVSVRLDLGGSRFIKKKNKNTINI